MKNNTYKTTTRYNKEGEVTFQESFSKGEFLTEEDLQLIEDRSSTFYMQDEEYERYLSEDFGDYNRIQKWNKYEAGSQYDQGASFAIGNNVSGGI